jgi:hypothetical protein
MQIRQPLSFVFETSSCDCDDSEAAFSAGDPCLVGRSSVARALGLAANHRPPNRNVTPPENWNWFE